MYCSEVGSLPLEYNIKMTDTHPFLNLNVGDSVLVPLPKDGMKSKKYQRIHQMKTRANQKFLKLWQKGKDFASSQPRRFKARYDKEKNGIRIWRSQ